MSRNFEEKAKKELSDLHSHMMNDGKHLEAAAVASAMRALESRCVGSSPGLKEKDDSLQALYALKTTATRAEGRYIKQIDHDPDEPRMNIYLDSGLKMTVSCSRFDAALFNVSWGLARCEQNLNFAFNIDASAVLSIMSR
jgi:hypothetical protein